MKFIKIISCFFIFCIALSINKVYGQNIMDRLNLESKKTPVVKNFPNNFPEMLTQRGQPIVYTKEHSNNFPHCPLHKLSGYTELKPTRLLTV